MAGRFCLYPSQSPGVQVPVHTPTPLRTPRRAGRGGTVACSLLYPQQLDQHLPHTQGSIHTLDEEGVRLRTPRLKADSYPSGKLFLTCLNQPPYLPTHPLFWRRSSAPHPVPPLTFAYDKSMPSYQAYTTPVSKAQIHLPPSCTELPTSQWLPPCLNSWHTCLSYESLGAPPEGPPSCSPSPLSPTCHFILTICVCAGVGGCSKELLHHSCCIVTGGRKL